MNRVAWAVGVLLGGFVAAGVVTGATAYRLSALWFFPPEGYLIVWGMVVMPYTLNAAACALRLTPPTAHAVRAATIAGSAVGVALAGVVVLQQVAAGGLTLPFRQDVAEPLLIIHYGVSCVALLGGLVDYAIASRQA